MRTSLASRPSLRDRSARPVLAADLGASKLAAAWVHDGRIGPREVHRVPREEGFEAVTRALASAFHALERRSKRKASAIGVGVAGQVDRRTGRVLFAPNLDWKNAPLGAVLAEEFHVPVAVCNDVQAITLGEWKHGDGRGFDDLVCLFVGTGIGGGIVSGGHLLRGAAGAAGEVGHMPIVSGGRKCHCPGRGCFEAYVGGWAISERVRERVRQDRVRGARLLHLAGGRHGAIDPLALERAARSGDPLAREILRETAGYFAAGVVAVVNALNPGRIVVGGTIAEAFPELLRAARRAIRVEAQAPAARAVTLRASRLGANAGLLGAADLAGGALGGVEP